MRFLDSRWEPKHPLRDTLWLVTGASALCCLGAPFAEVPNHWAFALGGLGYSAFLGFMSTGVCLLPNHIRARMMQVAIGVSSAGMLLMLALLAFLFHAHRVPALPTTAVGWVAGVFLAVLVAFAVRGWQLHFSRRMKPSA